MPLTKILNVAILTTFAISFWPFLYRYVYILLLSFSLKDLRAHGLLPLNTLRCASYKQRLSPTTAQPSKSDITPMLAIIWPTSPLPSFPVVLVSKIQSRFTQCIELYCLLCLLLCGTAHRSFICYGFDFLEKYRSVASDGVPLWVYLLFPHEWDYAFLSGTL